MASHLILDLKDPGVADLVKNWKIGESYKAEVDFTYEVKAPSSTSNLVTSIVSLDALVEEEVEEAAPPKAKKAKAAVPVTY